jgi:hypothetical protein
MPTVPLPLHVRGLRRMRLTWNSSAIETALVRASVGALGAGRPCCGHCRRTPLVGEQVYVYESGRRGEEVVCELCRPLRTTAPDRTVLVRSPEQLGSVRAVPART